MAAQDVMDGIRRSTTIILGLTLLDKLLALCKEMLFAYRFGVSHELDVFNVAYAFPAILAMFLGASVISALVPLYASWREEGDAKLANASSTAGYFCLAFFALLALACHLAAPSVFSLIGYGFPEGGDALGNDLVGLLSWLILLDGGGAILFGALQARKSFVVMYTAQLMINLSIIAVLSLGDVGVHGLAAGFLLGGAAKTLVMFLFLRGPGAPFRVPFRPDREALGAFLILAWPLAVSGLVINSNILVDQVMSTQLPEGSVSSLRYAYRINDLPVQLLIVAAARAIFPYISELAAANDLSGMREVFWRSMLFACVVALPVTAFTLLFSPEIVGALLERGAFGQEAAQSTSLTLKYYSLGMIFYAYAFINGVFFNAMRKNVALLLVGVVTMLVNAGLNALFIRLIGGPQAVAMSTTVTTGLTCAILAVLMQRFLGVTGQLPRARPFLLAVFACLAAWAAAFAAKAACRSLGLAPLPAFPVEAAVFGLVYLGLLRRSSESDLRWCLGIIMFSRGKKNVPEN